MIWKPHVTVAAVLERDGAFLMVEEEVNGRIVFNQPAGHLEDGEALVDAVVRETLEETGCHFAPQAVTGVYQWRSPGTGQTFLRVCFTGACEAVDTRRTLDDGIVRAPWLERDELLNGRRPLRSPMVLRCIDDYLDGIRYPLELIRDLNTDDNG